MNLSDTIVIMDKGAVIASGTPENLYRRPDNRFVAGFLGECNFIAQPDGTQLGIRPEHVLVGDASAAAPLRYRGELLVATFCGVHWKLFIRYQQQTVVAYAPLHLSPRERTPGEGVDWGFQPRDAMAFREREGA